MTIQQLISGIRDQINKTPQQMAQELSQASGFELGFRHSNGAFTLVRDDQVIELNAGNGAIVTVDGPGQTVQLTATGITFDGGTIQFKVPPGNVFFGYQPLNSYWMVTNPLDVISPLQKAPLVCKPTNLPDVILSTQIFVSRGATLPVETPAGPGTVTGLVPLSTFLEAQPLFGLNQQLLTLSRNLGEVIKNLSSMGL